MNAGTGLGKSQLKSLRDIFPGEAMTVVPAEMLIYGTDAGRRFHMPWAVVRPQKTLQVKELMILAHRDRIPVIPRARGTNVVSACVPDRGGIVLSCLNMDRIHFIDDLSFTAMVEPGVITHDLQKKALALGLFYPPDPASMRVSTLGGNISTNAGGMSAVKYGVTRDYVLGLEAVLPGGEIIRTGSQVHKNVVGLDITGLLTGSQGTLGVIVRAWLKLLPAPEYSATVLLCFKSEEQAIASVPDILTRGILPSALEFLPLEVMNCLAEYGPVPWPEWAGSALIVRVDGLRSCVEEQVDIIQEAVKGTVHQDLAVGGDEERIWEIRRMINPASFILGPDKISDDVVVPRSVVLKAVRGIRRISRSYSLNILAFGHIGDGNIHVNYMHDASHHGQKTKVEQARGEVLKLVLDLGGSISGEHGTGLSKKRFVSWQLSPGEIKILSAVKMVFDPHQILNPGKGW